MHPAFFRIQSHASVPRSDHSRHGLDAGPADHSDQEEITEHAKGRGFGWEWVPNPHVSYAHSACYQETACKEHVHDAVGDVVSDEDGEAIGHSLGLPRNARLVVWMDGKPYHQNA